jgi:hypothetical protein
MTPSLASYSPRTPLRHRLGAWLWGAIEIAALWRAQWRFKTPTQRP